MTAWLSTMLRVIVPVGCGGSTCAQQDLAASPWLGTGRCRLGRVFQVEHRFHRQCQAAVERGLQQLADHAALVLGLGGGHDLAAPEAAHCGLLEDHIATGNLQRFAGHRAERDQLAAFGQQPHQLACCLAGDRVDRAHDRRIAGQRAHAVLPTVLRGRHRIADAQCLEFVHAGIATHQIDHVDAACRREHGDGLANRAVGGVLHDPVAFLDMQELDQHQCAQRHGGELAATVVIQCIGQWDHAGRLGQKGVGPALVYAGSDDALADLQALDAFAQRIDHARAFAAADRRQCGLVAVVAAHRPQVMVVDGRTPHRDADLALAGLRCGPFAKFEHLGRVAVPGVDGCAHASLLPATPVVQRSRSQ
ncbi:hypothetical protein XAC2852_880048 [Xanthomonas citri pv. citri]|nr:hypothetical protein XAC2852_880048 [Xanthomonas citri pv. citri]